MTSIYPARSAGSAKIVTAPRGTLSTWALDRSKWAKRLMWYSFQYHALAASDCFHATSVKEMHEIRALGFDQPVAVLPNGIDISMNSDSSTRRAVSERQLLYFERIHPVKGLEMLLRSWRQVQQRCPEWKLVICGEDSSNYLLKLKHLSTKLAVQRVDFLPPVFGATRELLYRESDLYILPSFTENYGMTVAESMAFGVPVVTTTGTPWLDLPARHAGWVSEPTEGDLTRTLLNALSTSAERLHEMGMAAQSWMREDFSWDVIAQKTLDTYRWLIDGGECPSCIYLK